MAFENQRAVGYESVGPQNTYRCPGEILIGTRRTIEDYLSMHRIMYKFDTSGNKYLPQTDFS